MTLAKLLSIPSSERAARGLTHMPGEIAQQPLTWLDTLRRIQALEPRLAPKLRGALRALSRPQVLLLGAGTSDFVGRSVAHLLRSRWRCPVEVVPTTDFATHEQNLLVDGVPYVSVSFSRSGRSPESVHALHYMLERTPGMPQLIVTCDRDGAMARELSAHPNAVTLLLDDSVNDRGLAMTSSYTNLVVAGLALAHWNDLARFEELLHAVAAAWKRLAVVADVLAEQLAQRQFSKICFLGSGALNGVARESALKVLELTAGRASSSAESFLGLRHGPLSALDAKTLVVGLMSSEARVRRYELDVLREIRLKRLAAETVVIAQNPEPRLRDVSTYLLNVDVPHQVADDHLAPVMVLFGQLLGLHCSLAHGLKPDAPSPDGVIHRVVSGVEMHA
ncbi:MAG TPA: SIS domain-containing protein [Polyangiaceae bacterium]|nr:SIS domain-containing protein [Polyangiaceae bacterium]